MQQSGQFILMNRDEFKDWLFGNEFARDIALIQNHHTWSPKYSDFNGSNYFEMLNGMKDYHITPKPNGAGMADIAQNLTIFPDGMIAVCRSFEKNPAGIYGVNIGAICIENIGNFDVGGDVMNDEHKKSIIFVDAVLCLRFKLEPDQNSLVYHHWFNLNTGERLDYGTPKAGSTKTCPGTNFFGGNTVEAFNKNFLPLVKTEYDKLTYVPKYFNDELTISDWAKTQVFKLKDLGVFAGDTAGNFNPKTSITREAMAVVIYNYLKLIGKV